VLDLSRSEAGKMVLTAREINMADVLDDCIAMVREQCADAGLRFTMSGLEGQPLVLNGDPAKLRQIFLNLLSNAIKFTEKGGAISLAVAASGASIAVTVADTGIGMNPEDVEIAFQPFGQVDNRLERRYEGTGLGLPLTKALVDLHKGTIVIDSARGQGTCVTVTFPRAVPAELAQAV
jgi:signal transduction histidine kinase